MSKPPHLREMEILLCVGSKWAANQVFWPTVELEGHAVRCAVNRGYYLLDSKVIIYTDHENLKYILTPENDYVNNKPLPARGRLIRLAWFFREFENEIVHIPGEHNILADYISRLAKFPGELKYNFGDEDMELMEPVPTFLNRLQGTGAVHLLRLDHAVSTLMDKDWIAPGIVEIKRICGKNGLANERYVAEAKKLGAKFDPEMGVYKAGELIVIPDASNIRIKLMAMAHCGPAGHRSAEITMELLKHVVIWKGMQASVNTFVDSCIHCLSNKEGFPKRPYGRQIVARERNHIVSFDFAHVGESALGFNKVLVISDRLSNYTMLFPVRSENAEETAHALMQWISLFGIPKNFLSDQGPGFKNTVVSTLAAKYGIQHNFTTARAHWALGKQERLNRVIGETMRKLLSENRMDINQWVNLVPSVQMALNHTPSKATKGMAPITVFTGLEASNPLIGGFVESKTQVWQKVDLTNGQFQAMVEEIKSLIVEREITVHEYQDQMIYQREQLRLHTDGVEALEVEVGDLVMVYNHQNKAKSGNKWRGPARIVSKDTVNPSLLLNVEFLVDPRVGTVAKVEQVHAQHVRFFDYATCVVDGELMKQAEFFAKKKWRFETLIDLRQLNGEFEIQVLWENKKCLGRVTSPCRRTRRWL